MAIPLKQSALDLGLQSAADIDWKKLHSACSNRKLFFGDSFSAEEYVFYLGRLRESAEAGAWYEPTILSAIYSLRACLRGKLHGALKYNPDFGEAGRLIPCHRTMKQQVALLRGFWPAFATAEARARLAAAGQRVPEPKQPRL